MKILMAHNYYGGQQRSSGEDVMFDTIAALLAERGHEVTKFTRSSDEVRTGPVGMLKAALTGLHNPSMVKAMRQAIARARPDIVFVQNLYPLISPSVLSACRAMDVPVVMRCPNYRLLCPNGLFLSHGQVCERCTTGARELNCVLHNCERALAKSAAYAARNALARLRGAFKDNVSMFLPLTEFARQKLIDGGFQPERIRVLGGLYEQGFLQSAQPQQPQGDKQYMAFVGRVSPEKGLSVFVEAARALPHVPFKIAGDAGGISTVAGPLPANLTLSGHLAGDALREFYANARAVLVPSLWYEGLPVVALEAMAFARPVICSRIGGLSEVVDDGITGYLTAPGDAVDLAARVQQLWQHPELARQMGQSGLAKAQRQYSREAFLFRLEGAFAAAIAGLAR